MRAFLINRSKYACLILRRGGLRKSNNCRNWVYNASTLELLLNPLSSMKKAADYFNVDYRSILIHLDTELATIKDGKLVLLFSHEFRKKIHY